MNRAERRASASEGRRLQKLPWNEFKDVSYEARSKHIAAGGNPCFRPHAVWQNNKYIVQVFFNSPRKNRLYTKVMVRRSDGKPICSWTDLFRIKNEIFGAEVEAVQFLPRKSELVDDANLYWFWIEEIKEKPPF